MCDPYSGMTRLARWWYILRLRMDRDRFWHWLARRLPHALVKWATIVAIAHATTGPYANTVVPDVTAMTVLTRWR